MPETTSVAVVGLGGMGSRIARRLLETGHTVLVWNRTAAKTVPLVELGAVAVTSPAEAARRADAVLTMLADPSALRAVAEGSTGLAAGAGSSVTVIDMSTVGPAAVAALEALLPTETGLLDAPVLGSFSEAEDGSLRIFVGGPEPLVARWTPLLSALGAPLHVGPVGAGAAAKLVANAALLGTIGLLGEALALARGLGLASDTAFDVLEATPLATQSERRRRAVATGEYPRRFALSLARKDADLIADGAEAAGVELRLGAALRSWLAEAESDGWGDHDYAVLLGWLLERAGRPARTPPGR